MIVDLRNQPLRRSKKNLVQTAKMRMLQLGNQRQRPPKQQGRLATIIEKTCVGKKTAPLTIRSALLLNSPQILRSEYRLHLVGGGCCNVAQLVEDA